MQDKSPDALFEINWIRHDYLTGLDPANDDWWLVVVAFLCLKMDGI